MKSDERYYYIGKRSTDKEILSYWETAQKALEEEARLVEELEEYRKKGDYDVEQDNIRFTIATRAY